MKRALLYLMFHGGGWGMFEEMHAQISTKFGIMPLFVAPYKGKISKSAADENSASPISCFFITLNSIYNFFFE